MSETTVAPRPGRRAGRAIGVALIALVWAAATLLGIECALRLRWSHLVRGNDLIQNRDGEMMDVMYASHPDLWAVPWITYRPNNGVSLRRGERELVVRINSIGLRSNEVEVPKPAGIYRIVCIGASTTVEGETNNTTYPALLERMLNEWWGSEHFEVVNGGICGLNSWTLLPKLDFFASLQPDLVIHYNGVNDYTWIALPVWWQSHAPPEHDLMRRLELVKTLLPELLVMDDDMYDHLLQAYTIQNRREMIDVFREKDIPVAIASFDTPDIRNASPGERVYLDWDLREIWGLGYVPYETYQDRITTRNDQIRSLCLQERCLYFPVAEALSLGMDHYLDVCHMKPNGIERKAEVIASLVRKYLASMGHVPPGGPSPR